MSEINSTETSASSRRSSRASSSSRRKPKKNQIPFGIGIFFFIVLFGIYLSTKSSNLAFFGLQVMLLDLYFKNQDFALQLL